MSAIFGAPARAAPRCPWAWAARLRWSRPRTTRRHAARRSAPPWVRAARWERGSGRRSQKRQWVSQTISRSNSCRSHVRPEQTQTQAELSASCDLVVGRTLPPRPRHPRGSCQRRSSRPRRCCPRQAGACSLLPWAPRPPRRAAAAPRSAASLRGGAWAARGSGALCHVRLMSTTLPASSRAGRARNVASTSAMWNLSTFRVESLVHSSPERAS